MQAADEWTEGLFPTAILAPQCSSHTRPTPWAVMNFSALRNASLYGRQRRSHEAFPLSGASLAQADLTETSFDDGIAERCTFTGSRLCGVSAERAKLAGQSSRGAIVDNADSSAVFARPSAERTPSGDTSKAWRAAFLGLPVGASGGAKRYRAATAAAVPTAFDALPQAVQPPKSHPPNGT
jgi:hypothetical protein